MLRVIGGQFRGRKIRAPEGLATRPVLGRVREALFNVIGGVEGFRVLDLYAGTGAVGIEALSRGAESAVFVDSGFKQCRIISENLTLLGVSAEVIHLQADRAIGKLREAGSRFDFIFADPPYEHGLGVITLDAVDKGGILAVHGIMALTVRHNEEIPGASGALKQIFNRRYGDTRLVIFTPE
ncbi:16S rRNA (guanine(966)-N(2))-methyltransferase RsmD [bacterium]|nr:16S rRNA (guanine(966)-N(2))-methyltransferase RsmD [bacterium]